MTNIDKLSKISYNNGMDFTNHSIVRCQQRGISEEVAAFIFKYGNFVRTHNDRKYFINKSKLKKLFQKHKPFILKNDKEILSTAVIANNKTIITTMKISKKINWS